MANKECEKILNLIPLYIDNMLSDNENDQIARHLDRCSDCRNEYNYLKAIIKTAKEIPEKEIPKDFHKNLMEKVNLETQKKKRHITLKHISAGVAAATAAAAVIAISFVALGEVENPQKTELSNQYITSRLSDEPIQKEAGSDMLSEQSYATEDNNNSRVKTNKAETPKDVTTEEKEAQTSEQIPATISFDEEIAVYTTATVTLTDDNRNAVLEILSDFEKDETGYIVEDIEELIEKLKDLGANVTITSDNASTKNYIMIK